MTTIKWQVVAEQEEQQTVMITHDVVMVAEEQQHYVVLDGEYVPISSVLYERMTTHVK